MSRRAILSITAALATVPVPASAQKCRMDDADRAWLSEDGIPGRPWFRSLYAASDEDSGYASWILPGLRWSIEHKDKAQLAKETERLLAVFRSLNATVSGVDAALKS